MSSSINENGNKYKPFLGAKLSSWMLFETLPQEDNRNVTREKVNGKGGRVGLKLWLNLASSEKILPYKGQHGVSFKFYL